MVVGSCVDVAPSVWVAEAAGLPAYLVNDPQDIDEAWLQGTERIGITSGASTPEWLVDAVVQRLQPRQVENLAVMEENVTFVLPKELQPAVSVAESSSR